MDHAITLTEIEEIKQLKARYCRLLDTKQWDAWRHLFTDDFVSDTSNAGGKLITGADEFVAFTCRNLRARPTVHHVHAPEITLTSPATAAGIWALDDVVRLAPMVNMHGYGYYTETYEKADGTWKIGYSRLTRLREDLFSGPFSLYLSPRLRTILAKGAQRAVR